MAEKIHFFRNMSIRNKLLSYFFLIIAMISIFVFLPIYMKTLSILRSSTQQQAIDAVIQTSTALDNTLNSICYMADFISYSTEIQSILTEKLDAPYESYDDVPPSYFSTAERVLITNYSSNKLNTINIFADNGMIFEVPNRIPTFDSHEISVIKELAESDSGRISWHFLRDGELCLLKEIRNITTTRNLGALTISVKKKYLDSSINQSFISGKGNLVILDLYGNYICGKAYAPDLYRSLSVLDSSSSSFSNIEYEGSPFLVTANALPDKGLVVYGLISEDALYGQLNQLFRWAASFVAAMTGVVSFVVIFFSNSLIRPLHNMANSMDIAAKGDFTVSLPIESDDEIGQLSRHFNSMVQKVNSLIDNVYKKELLYKDAEFKMLQAQINPHFIYNVLDTISWTVQLNGMPEISKMASALSRLMRISINKNQNITLKEELSCVQDYLLIQKIRYQDKISAVIDVDDRLNDLVIPKLILEPIVENAVVHGLEGKVGTGLILVRGELSEDTVIFTIKDNGIGITQKRLEEIWISHSKSNSTHTGLGFLNVHSRIQYIYGTDYGLDIKSQPNSGTTVTIQIPYISLPDQRKNE
ncbi:HAMP domain-containing protein [Clostridium sp. MCC353]|uniref:sensor histidine kinase n=1 Tax=Clostridium sp. MCC353 TaxID=2592646 RepID=UPI001C0289C7|nr:sensor histidine kinase [Clostridium sp. MCC353]MBT9779243.1 HAMP domain-containing protein [Clostridium sp. MCC353]